MKAEIVSVGTELLLGQIVDTNAAYIARALAGLGFSLYRKTTIGDNHDRLSSVVRDALERADVIMVTGGLGPTEDDLTKETVADVLGVELVESAEALLHLRTMFASRGTPMPESNRKQALVPESGAGQAIPNPIGTAPGVLFKQGVKRVVCMPGVPREMKLMMDGWVTSYLREYLRNERGVEAIRSRTVRTIGIGESRLEQLILDLAHGRDNPSAATYAGDGECEVRITARAATEAAADAMLDGVEEEVRCRLGRFAYGGEADTLASVVGRCLRRAGLTICTAESCTGGLLAGKLTSIPGSSDYFERGFVTYSNRSKNEELGVDENTLAVHGAVSRESAIRMARGAANASGARISLSITGIAGPGGGSQDKPVGLVHFGLVDARMTRVIAARIRFNGDRESVRNRACSFSLDLIRRHLEEAYPESPGNGAEITHSGDGGDRGIPR